MNDLLKRVFGSGGAAKELHKRLGEERAALVKELAATEKLEPESLKRLEQLNKSFEESKDWRHWPVVLAVGLALIFAAALYWKRKQTSIDLNATVTELAFTSAVKQDLIAQQAVASLSADGIQELELESGETFAAPPESGGCFLSLKVDKGSLTLAPFEAPRGLRVRLGRDLSGLHWRFGGQPADALPLTVQLTVVGTVSVDTSCGRGLTRQTLSAGEGVGALVLVRVKKDFSISYVTEQLRFEREIAMEEITFAERREAVAGAVKELSGLLAGSVFLNDLEGKKLELRSAEYLTFGKSQGKLRTVTADKESGGLKVEAQALVEGMETGSGEQKRGRMPSYLEWWYAQEWVRYLGGGMTVFGTLYAILKALKIVG